MRKPRIVMVFPFGTTEPKAWIGTPVKRMGRKIGTVIKVKAREDGMLDVTATLDSLDEMRLIEVPDKRGKRRK